MSRFIKFALTICMLANACVAACADTEEFETNVTSSGYSAQISGTADTYAGTVVSVAVIRHGKDISSVVEDTQATSQTSLNDSVVCVAQTTVDAQNEFGYTCVFDQEEKSGTCTLRVQVYGEPEVREKTFVFENATRKSRAQTNILSNDTEVLRGVLADYATDLNVEKGEKYITFSEKEKGYVLKNISEAENANKEQEYMDSVDEITDVREMKSLSKENLKTFVDAGTVIGVTSSQISEYSGLSFFKKESFIADLYSRIRNKETPDEIGTEFTLAMTQAKNNPLQPPIVEGSQTGDSFGVTGNSSSGSVSGKPHILDVPQNEGFVDMESTPWAKTAVQTLYERGIVNGRTKNTFCPTETVKREEFLKMVIESLNVVGISEENKSFVDVDTNAWYSHYVDTGVGCGIINGMSDNKFGIGMPITRQDMATILYRAVQYAEVNLYSVEDNTFTDENDISDYAKDAIKVLSCANVINGMDDGTFMPKKTATRAEAAVMLYNLLYR